MVQQGLKERVDVEPESPGNKPRKSLAGNEKPAPPPRWSGLSVPAAQNPKISSPPDLSTTSETTDSVGEYWSHQYEANSYEVCVT